MSIGSILLFSLVSFMTGADSIGHPVGADLVFVGDAMQHQDQLDWAKAAGNGYSYNYDDCFTLIAPEITAADYAVANLEVPLGGGPNYSGYPCFSAPDTYAIALRDAGFDMMLTANNHTLDRGDKGARRTLDALDKIGLDHIGTYHDAAQRDTLVPFIKDINGIKFGFLNYTYGTNGIMPRDGMEVAMIDRTKIAEEVKRTRKAGAEVLVVAVHWGIEYVLLENAAQRDLADYLVNLGVDMIIGGHPHVIQPMKMVHNERENKDVLVVYSLGNFISNMKTVDTRGGAMVKVRVERDTDGKARVKNAAYDTFFSAKPTVKGSNFRVIPSYMSDSIPAAQRNHWILFNNSAGKIFDKHNVRIERIRRDRD